MHQLCSALTTVFTKLVNNPKTPVRLWAGEVENKNPETQVPTGTFRKTMNLDFTVSQSVYDKAFEWKELDKEAKGGDWVEIDVFGKKMVLIDCRENKAKNQLIVQFAVPNTGSWTEIGNSAFKDTFERLYAEANNTSKESSKKVDSKPKETAKAKVDDEFDRLMNG